MRIANMSKHKMTFSLGLHCPSCSHYFIDKFSLDAEAREAQLADLVQELMLTLKIIEDHDNDPDKGIGFQNELATRMILDARAKLTELNISTEALGKVK